MIKIKPKKIRVMGNSKGIVIPKSILDLWNVEKLDLYIDKDQIIIKPYKEEKK